METSPYDLWLAPGPGVPQGLAIPAAELVERFSRSSGPGGQGVNTTDTRVELLFDPAASATLSEIQKARVLSALSDRLVDGQLVVAASEHRSQLRNRRAARERLAALLRMAVAPPGPQRRATRPTAGSRRRRLDTKKHRGRIKAARGRVRSEHE
ncbi:alternative ribosome rescue aminoacyl-tRNA hydrolase ArfB [Tessaracoccus terricola]